MGSDVITVDLSGVLTEKQLREIEEETNRKIWENTAVEVFYPSEEELEKLSYRSKKELTGQVRLVRFQGSDLCACCGTHVTHTGEIGAVKILTVENFREGVRVTMICGKRVLDYLNMVNDQNHQIPQTLVEECWVYLNIIRSLNNMCRYILGNIPAAHRFDRKPHSQEIIRIFSEHFTVHEIAPAADNLS